MVVTLNAGTKGRFLKRGEAPVRLVLFGSLSSYRQRELLLRVRMTSSASREELKENKSCAVCSRVQ